MDYIYVATGGITVFGCAVDKLYVDPTWNSRFKVGETAYFKTAAIKKGRLEKVYVYHITDNLIYEDPLHALYNEEELVTYEEALALILNYRDRYNAAQELQAKNC